MAKADVKTRRIVLHVMQLNWMIYQKTAIDTIINTIVEALRLSSVKDIPE